MFAQLKTQPHVLDYMRGQLACKEIGDELVKRVGKMRLHLEDVARCS